MNTTATQSPAEMIAAAELAFTSLTKNFRGLNLQAKYAAEAAKKAKAGK